MSYYKEHTAKCSIEFSIYQLKKGFVVDRDGKEVREVSTVSAAHKLIKRILKEDKIENAGVTEVFGRNRQFISTPRYAFKTYKEEDNGE